MEDTLQLNIENPYAEGFIINYSDGTSSLERDTDDTYTTQPGDKYHTVVDGDDLTLLAGKFYNNSQLWHIIAKANPQIDDIFYLPIGQDIIIPKIL